MRLPRHIFILTIALLAMLCLPIKIAAQAQRFVADSTRFANTTELPLENLEFLDNL